MRAAGRVWQTVQFVLAWGRPIHDRLACAYLTEAEFALYMTMSRPERQHHLRVLNRLLADGHGHPALLKADLLHDVGKTRYHFALPERVLVVLVKAFARAKFEQWSQGEPRGWRRPFVISAKHPAWGAAMAATVGLDATALALIRRHQSPLPDGAKTETDELLLVLQSADDRS